MAGGGSGDAASPVTPRLPTALTVPPSRGEAPWPFPPASPLHVPHQGSHGSPAREAHPSHTVLAGKVAPRRGQGLGTRPEPHQVRAQRGWARLPPRRRGWETPTRRKHRGRVLSPSSRGSGTERARCWGCLHPQFLLLLLILCPVLKTALSAASPRKVTGFRFLFFPWKPSNRSWPHYCNFLGLSFFSAGLTMSHFLRRLREAPCAPLPLLCGGKSYPGRSGERLPAPPSPCHAQGRGPGVGAGDPSHMWGTPLAPPWTREGWEGAQGWAMLRGGDAQTSRTLCQLVKRKSGAGS